MPSAFSRLADLLEQRGKHAAKTLYRGPVIAAARVWRSTLLSGTCCIGITGSAGKTTTKDLLHAIIASHARCVKSHDSNNQLYSIARTLICTGTSARYVVQELGADHPGGFDPMLALLQPRVGVVTNIGTDHIKAFRTPDAVACEKRKLIEALPANGIAVLNADDERVLAMARSCKGQVITFGTQPDADLRGEALTSSWPQPLSLRVQWRGATAEVATRLHGRHQSTAVMGAIATACALGVPLEQAAAAVGGIDPLRGRMSLYTTANGIHFVRDDWKAPVWSMPLSLEFLADADAPRKFLVLGTLSDKLGNDRRFYLRAVEAALAVAHYVVLVGDRGASIAQRLAASDGGGRVHGFADIRTASTWLREFLAPGDLVLLKGSNRADHLARLALAFDADVRCWRRRCGRLEFCDNCRLLGEPAIEVRSQ